MSLCISSREGVKARKPYRCTLCGEGIAVGEIHDTRTGVQDGDGFWTMRMHPECRAFEETPETKKRLRDWDWYEDVTESAFDRADARAHAAKAPATKDAGGGLT